MTYSISLGDWSQQQADARKIRQQVFIIEQQVPVEMEWDEADADCVHALAYDADGLVVGTARLLPDGHIGRMAVNKNRRGQGIGSALLKALMNVAKQRGDNAVLLHAQVHAAAFYARFGFIREEEEFLEAGIAHVMMRYTFY